jgi:uncharacterized protein (TIGR03435 family)
MKMSGIATLLALAGAALTRPQTAAADRPVFEAASIKLSGPQSVRESEGGPGSSDPERYRYTVASLLDLIQTAYEVQPFQVSSRTPLDRQTFDLVAKAPPGATKQQFREMLQNLLSERFHLKAHFDSRQFPAYELVAAKSGPKLKVTHPTPANEGWPELPDNRPAIMARNSISAGCTLVRLKAHQQPVSALLRLLRQPDGLPLVDGTGLKGVYDFALEYAKDFPRQIPDREADPPPAPDIFSALQQQLGLQLVRKKLPFDVLVIDSADRLPTEN